MGFDGRSISYTLTPQQWGAAFVRLKQQSPVVAISSWLFPLLFGVGAILNVVTANWLPAGLLAVAAAFMAAYAYSPRANAFLLRRQIRELVGRPTTLTLSDDGLSYASPPTSGSIGWDGIAGIIVDSRVVMITRDKTVAWAVIPRTAFSDDTQIDAFKAAILAGVKCDRATRRRQPHAGPDLT